MRRRGFLAALAAVATLGACPCGAADIHVRTSGAFTESLKELVPAFERRTGHRVVMAFGASMGGAPDSIPSRLDRGEIADVVILAAGALDALAAKGQVVPGSRTDLVRSVIGLVVKAGAPRPDIATVPGLRRALLEAKSIAYSASASGVYVSTELFAKLGVEAAVKDKSIRVVSERVARVVARGEAEIGFQQVSELITIPGVDYVGPLPPEVQKATYFSAGIGAKAKEPEAARELVRFLRSEEAAPVIERNGLEPAR